MKFLIDFSLVENVSFHMEFRFYLEFYSVIDIRSYFVEAKNVIYTSKTSKTNYYFKDHVRQKVHAK